MNFWHQYPFIRLIIPYIMGIQASEYIPFKIPYIVFFLFAILFFGIIHLFRFNHFKGRNVFGILLFITFLLFGIYYAKQKMENTLLTSEELYLCEFEIKSPPELKKNSLRCVCESKIVSKNSQLQRVNQQILVSFDRDSLTSMLTYGDVIRCYTPMNKISLPMNPHVFNYKKYLADQQVHFVIKLESNEWKKLNSIRRKNMTWYALKVKAYFMKQLHKADFESDELGIAAALLLGDNDLLNKQTKLNFSNAGAMHVLCVSGLHVGIIYLLISSLFLPILKLRHGRLLKYFMILLFLWAYALITAFSPSVLRATTMFSFMIIAKMLNRKANIYNIIAASAFFLLIINPLMIMKIGFQLSYVAVTGIVAIYPLLNQIYQTQNRFLQKVFDLLNVSLAAQIATFPLAIYYFHKFPIYFLLTNLIVVSFAGFLLCLGMGYLVLGFIPVIQSLFSIIVKFAFSLMYDYIRFINQLPSASIDKLVLSAMSVVLLYLLIIALGQSFIKRSKKWLMLSLTSLLILMGLFMFRKFSVLNSNKVFIYQIKIGLAMDFMKAHKNYFLADSIILNHPKVIEYSINPNRIFCGIKNTIPLSFDEKCMIRDDFFKYKNFVKDTYFSFLILKKNESLRNINPKVKVDYLILQSIQNFEYLDSLFKPKKIVVLKRGFYQSDSGTQNKDKIWCLQDQGVFLIKKGAQPGN